VERLIEEARRALREGRLEELARILAKLLSKLLERYASLTPPESNKVLAEIEEVLRRIGILPEYVVVVGKKALQVAGEKVAALIPIGKGGLRRPEENKAFILVTPRGSRIVAPAEARKMLELIFAYTPPPPPPSHRRLHAHA